MGIFQLCTDLVPKGDQPKAIDALVRGYKEGRRFQTLLGVTGSGKTLTMANVIHALDLPTLVISHNKTLAAQLYSEFKVFFPRNAVEYFVSYYDYYQPEAYIPQRDIYIEKDASINEKLDRLRMAATSSILRRKDTIIVASVSCIYSLGSPEDYKHMVLTLERGMVCDRNEILSNLVSLLYERNDFEVMPGKFRARGDVIEVFPPYADSLFRIELFGDEIESISMFSPISGEILQKQDKILIYPAKHFVLPEEKLDKAIEDIANELAKRLEELKSQNKILEASRLEARTFYDIEMLKEVGTCKGIENYSRHLTGRSPGERPYCLLDYFPSEFLTIVDESHVTLPQVRGMYGGDYSRKKTLVEYGFRLPSSLDNRPQTFEEWENLLGKVLYVSATPGPYELKKTKGEVVEQVIRPTGLLDPLITVEPAGGQIPHLIKEIQKRIEKNERVLVTTSTKRLAEDIAGYFQEQGIKGAHIHCEMDAFERVQVINDLRKGTFDVLVGINLLREGLDLPEVALVAILDADKEGFLRSETSLIQIMGRSARNAAAEVILYADRITDSMKKAILETNRRREIQIAYNSEHGITPQTIVKRIREGISEEAERIVREAVHETPEEYRSQEILSELHKEMMEAAEQLDFEKAARLRDRIFELQGQKDDHQPKKGKKRRR